MRGLLLTFVCIFSLSNVQAQIHEIGVFVGGSNYIGEIGSANYIAPNEGAFGILYKWNKSPRHAYRLSYTQSNISSRDSKSAIPARKQRDYDFKNSIQELSLGIEFNFFDFNLHKPQWITTPYIHTGINYFKYDELYLSKKGKMYKKENEYTFAIPMTLGIKTKITRSFILAFEISARYTFTDNLDGSNPKEEAYQKFGNINSNDWYVFTGFTLTYTFGDEPCYCRE